jgi:hypothetical protein
MYKDRERQRVANRVHAKAYRLRKGMTAGYDAGMTKVEGMTQGMTVIKTKEDAVKAVEKLSVPDWRVPKVVGCRKFGDSF